ncbi:MAG: hypothetical protein ABII68_03135 [Pseudomonadota bacterium]
MKKDIKKQIEKLIREIDVYREHSLFDEARGKCIQLAKLIKQSDEIENKQRLLTLVSRKLKALKNDARTFEEAGASLRMSTKEEDVIKQLFYLSTDESDVSPALVGAEALLVFGQFEKALGEFRELLKEDSLRVDAAKNILRCHIGLSALENAVSQYREWFSSDQFSPEQLGKIHYFLQDILDKKKTNIRLPEPKSSAHAVKDTAEEEDFVDILSVLMPQDAGCKEDEDTILDVNFQRGNMISLIVSKKNTALIDCLEIGSELNDVMFFSTDVMFKSTCVVSEKREIESGPKKGDYTLVMKID